MINNEPWHIDPKVYLALQHNPQKSGYILVEGGTEDYQKVVTLYQKSPVKGYIVGNVQAVHNSALTRQFEGKVMVLHERANSPAFQAKWDQESDLPIRQRIHQALSQITIQHKSTYYSVQFYPAFHGTKAFLIDSILKTGFANLATTDNGFFGKGLYNTQHAEYAHRVYSDGTLLFNWVAFYSAYPVTLPDMSKLQGSANYSNYDAHYVLVAPKNPNNPNEVVYFPITQFQNLTYDELVVFDSSHILPRYLITLAPDALNLQTLSPHATGVTLMTAISSYFPEAPSSLQSLLQKELATLTSQLMTPLNFTQLSLLTLIERSKGETDPTIKLHLANKISKGLEVPFSNPPLPPSPSQSAFPSTQLPINHFLPQQGAVTYQLPQTSAQWNFPKLPDALPPQQQEIGFQLSPITPIPSFPTQQMHPPVSLQPSITPKALKEIRTLRGHTDCVNTLVQLADGMLASGSWDKTIKIWNPQTGACLHTLQGHMVYVNALVQLADGALASGSTDKTIKIWNPQTGACLRTLDGHTSDITALAQLADGALASGLWDKTIKIWNPQTGACLCTLQGHTFAVSALAQLVDGTLASGSYDKTIKIWNPQTGVCLHTLQGHTDWIYDLARLADGTLASGSQDNTIKIWNPQTGACLRNLQGHTFSVRALTQLADGTLASGAGDKTIKIWNPQTGACLHTLQGHTDLINALVQLADGTLASGSFDNTIKIWG
jgi:WD40 repeat protein